MCKFEFFSQKHTSPFRGFIRFFSPAPQPPRCPPHGLCPAASAPLANCSAIAWLFEPGRRLVEITITFFIAKTYRMKLVYFVTSFSGSPLRSRSAAMARMMKAMLRPKMRMICTPSSSFITSSAEWPCTIFQ